MCLRKTLDCCRRRHPSFPISTELLWVTSCYKNDRYVVGTHVKNNFFCSQYGCQIVAYLTKKWNFHVVKSLNSLNLFLFVSLTSGPGRRPSQTVIEQLKATNKSLKLGQRLCRSRSPDFLLEIIQRQVKFSWDRRWSSMIIVVFIWIPCLTKCCKTFNCNCYVTQDSKRRDPPTGHPKTNRFSR